MGGIYISLYWISMQVLSLIPGLFLGIHTTYKLVKPQESHQIWKLIAYAYLALGLAQVYWWHKVSMLRDVN